MQMYDYMLKIETQDEQGLVFKISDVIFKNKLNIINNQEFVDHDANRFFFRAIIEADFILEEEEFICSIKEIMPENTKIVIKKHKKKNIIVFATKETHCLGDLLIKNYSDELNANIKAVISNHNDLRELVEKFGIDYHFIDSTDKDRMIHEKEILEVVKQYEFDYVILAKYMRILSANFVNNFNNNIINIHHSFLPAFIGANPYKQAFIRGVKIIGATAHFVNHSLDEGPIITQAVIDVNHEMSWQDMRKAGRNVERNVLSAALDLVFEDRVFISNNKTVIL